MGRGLPRTQSPPSTLPRCLLALWASEFLLPLLFSKPSTLWRHMAPARAASASQESPLHRHLILYPITYSHQQPDRSVLSMLQGDSAPPQPHPELPPHTSSHLHAPNSGAVSPPPALTAPFHSHTFQIRNLLPEGWEMDGSSCPASSLPVPQGTAKVGCHPKPKWAAKAGKAELEYRHPGLALFPQQGLRL